MTAYGPDSIYRALGDEALQHWRRAPLADHVRWTGHLLCSSDASTFADRVAAKFPTAQADREHSTRLPARLGAATAFDESAGCCEMRAAVRAIADELEPHVTYRSGSVHRLLFDGDKVSGVSLSEGTELLADLVVLAAGAWVVDLLPDLVTRGRVSLSGQVVAELDLRADELARFALIPVSHPCVSVLTAQIIRNLDSGALSLADHLADAAGLYVGPTPISEPAVLRFATDLGRSQ